MMNRPRPIILILLCAAAALTGCTERRLIITSDPAGALVYLNDAEMGRTPMEVDFTYFGVYDVRLRKEGYEPLVTSAEAKAPLYELPGIDFLAMLLPVRKSTVIRWHFELQPAVTDEDALLDRARDLRDQFQSPPSP